MSSGEVMLMKGVGWISVAERLPTDQHVVLVCGWSGYIAPHSVFVERAFLDREWRPWRDGEPPRWIDMAGDALTDRWQGVTHWTPDQLWLPPDVRTAPTHARPTTEMG